MAKLKLTVLISGRGSNLQSLLDACAGEDYPAQIVQVISNIPGVAGLEKARKAGIPTAVVDHKTFPDRISFEAALNTVIDDAAPGLICLAGFMRLLSDPFVNAWRDRIINIHPSLLPAFRGLHIHERVLDAGVRFSGCTVHYVRPEMDEGPIIVQAAVPVLKDDDSESLSARVLEQEHRVYPLAVRLIAEGRARVTGARVLLEDVAEPKESLLNPCPD